MAESEASEAQVIEGVLLAVEAALLIVRRDAALPEICRRELEDDLSALVRRLIVQGLRSSSAPAEAPF